ncbi:MAG: DUF4835 family protein [Bacteroidales bacterium]|nr:DUF4835 family protein [Bacteroidales bacterium]
MPEKTGFWGTILLLFLSASSLRAQELNARVQINTDQIGGTDKAVYESFRTAVTEFLNSRLWTQIPFARNERIDCSFVFIFQKRDDSHHTAEIQITSRRPVYNASYMSPMLNVRQVAEFDYQEGKRLDYNPNGIDDNLVAMLAFWSYLILGMDFDSFAPLGGDPFFQEAQNIVSQAQGTLGDNWRARDDDKNCWGWISALNDERQKDLRMFNYQYHRQGLDLMTETPDEARKNITGLFASLRPVRNDKPRSPLLGNLSDTKIDEWIQLYSLAPDAEKQQVYELLNYLWPGQGNRLEAIRERP